MTMNTTRPSGANGEAMPLAEDILTGATAIGEFIYGRSAGGKDETNRRRVYHAIEKSGLPTFKLGGVVCARKSTILRWIADQERAAEGRAA